MMPRTLNASNGQFGPVLNFSGGPVGLRTGLAAASRFAFAFLPMAGKFTTAESRRSVQIVGNDEGQQMLVGTMDVVGTLVASDPGLSIPLLERRPLGAPD